MLKALSEDAELRETIRTAYAVDADLGKEMNEIEFLPMTAMAAICGENSFCSLECEKYILKKKNIDFDEKQILETAVKNKWYKEEGTALYNVGRVLENFGLLVVRQYQCDISDIIIALEEGDDVIVAVDSEELTGDKVSESIEDTLIGQIPNHTIVVKSYDSENRTVTVYDPNSSNTEDVYTIDEFIDAWADSKYYLVTVASNENKPYIPRPIDLSDVILTEDLNDLTEAIAENAHEVWAKCRQAEGWTYGPERDDTLKQTPDMVPYSKLPESEKSYDRDMAMKTIKLLKKLGYDIIRNNNTELYQVMRQRMQETKQDLRCGSCGNVVYEHQAYCDKCGKKLSENI